ncbi:MAG: hypothetical protein J6A29_00025 [Clostridia bacterium]|nr:hypothetical protein [Clostridia bacterium]
MRATKEINKKKNVGEFAPSVRPTSEARQNKGITLIALIITIIVMLILVAVTITTAINGGLFEKAGEAVGDMQNAINKEQELSNGRIQVNGVWYDSIDSFLKGIPSKNQETTLQWKQFAASNEEILALNSYGDIYKYSTPENDTELDAKFRELIANNGKVVNISLADVFDYVYIMENGRAYYLQDSNFVCINDDIETLKNEKIVNVTLLGFIITEDGKAYALNGDIWLNDYIPALKDKKILNVGPYELSESETVTMVILDDQKAYYVNSEGTLICFSDEHEELKNKKIVSTPFVEVTIFVTSDGKAYFSVGGEIISSSDSVEELKDKKIVKIDICTNGMIYILDSGELLLGFETLSSLNEQYEALQGKKIMGYDSINKLVWLEGGESYYSINDDAIVNFGDMVAFLQGKNIVQIAANYGNFTAVDINGKVWTWGYNWHGQLGDGTETNRSTPICISDIEDNSLNGVKIKQISSGGYHTVAVDSNGKVWAWGADDERLGKTVKSKARAFRLATMTASMTTPTCISDREGSTLNNIKIKQISAGSEHTVALDENGKVWTWGYSGYGQLGDGTTNSISTPICISDIAENPLNGINIVQISTEYNHTVALDSNGKIWTWGSNWIGQLGDGTETDSSTPICISNIAENPLNGIKIKQISVGSYHTVALDENGKVWAWGNNGAGQLADGTETSSSIPICISDINSELNGKQITVVEAGASRTVLIDNNNNKYNIFGKGER